jgi:hypothetical protein
LEDEAEADSEAEDGAGDGLCGRFDVTATTAPEEED